VPDKQRRACDRDGAVQRIGLDLGATLGFLDDLDPEPGRILLLCSLVVQIQCLWFSHYPCRASVFLVLEKCTDCCVSAGPNEQC
jgi:hypothetical protein